MKTLKSDFQEIVVFLVRKIENIDSFFFPCSAKYMITETQHARTSLA